MDLPNVLSVGFPRTRAELRGEQPGSAWLAGGTWLFSEPQPALRHLVDLAGMGWPALEVSDAGLRIAATCTIAELEAFEAPPDWLAAPLLAACCRALLGSFKIWAMATVGGNMCLALPAAPMLALTVALQGAAVVWRPDGSDASVPMQDFALGPQRTVLASGDVLRAIDLPLAALRRRTTWRQASLQTMGRSAALLVGALTQDGFALTVTASTIRPLRRCWTGAPTAAEVDAWLTAIPAALWFEDVHGALPWRRHMTRRLAAELHAELLR